MTPKFGLASAPKHAGSSLCTRYFMPWATHPTLAVTGSQCFSACALMKGTVTEGLVPAEPDTPVALKLEHPLGTMEVVMHLDGNKNDPTPVSAGVIRTARKIAEGSVFVPADVWS